MTIAPTIQMMLFMSTTPNAKPMKPSWIDIQVQERITGAVYSVTAERFRRFSPVEQQRSAISR
jgi:hypothetical protein